jgi:hypothetical protein
MRPPLNGFDRLAPRLDGTGGLAELLIKIGLLTFQANEFPLCLLNFPFKLLNCCCLSHLSSFLFRSEIR